MREIKFRAWDDADGIHRDEGWMSYGITNIACDADHIMQYTGKKDKAGKEMYGGDIIKDHEGAIKRIEYIDDYMTFCPFTGIEWDLYNEGSNHFKYCYDVRDDGSRPLKFLCWYESYELEVIGNIHENPDLLENDEEAV